MLGNEETEWVVYRLTMLGKEPEQFACEPWCEWDEYAQEEPDYPADEQLIARGLTQEQAKKMVELSKEN